MYNISLESLSYGILRCHNNYNKFPELEYEKICVYQLTRAIMVLSVSEIKEMQFFVFFFVHLRVVSSGCVCVLGGGGAGCIFRVCVCVQ